MLCSVYQFRYVNLPVDLVALNYLVHVRNMSKSSRILLHKMLLDIVLLSEGPVQIICIF